MSVKIRLQRVGMKKQAHYRLVAIDSRKARDGKELEVLGFYNPKNAENALHIQRTRVDHWLSKGAQASDTVKTLLARSAREIIAPAAEQPVSAS